MPVRARGVTLIELLIVIIVVAILASLGLINYGPLKEKSLDREAVASLRLIMAAEKVYRMEVSEYYAGGTNVNLNDNLRLLLSTGSPHWDYSTLVDNAASPQETCAQAVRTDGSGRSWCMDRNDVNPVSGTCSAASSCP